MTTTCVKQANLPGQSHVAEGPIDHLGMYAMHYAFRRDISDIVDAVRRGSPDDTAQWQRLHDYWEFFVDFLHHHHTAEDECYWPQLAADVHARGTAADLEIVKAMESEHETLDASLTRCDSMFAAVVDGPTQENILDLYEELATLRSVLDEHMAHEERETLPLVQRVMDPTTYKQVEKAIGKTYSLRHVLVLAAWALHGLPPDVQREIAPLPQRILFQLTHRRFARRHEAAFR